MYGASLGFIIMIAVVYRVQIDSIGLQILTTYGGALWVKFSKFESARYNELETRFNDSIEAMTFKYAPHSYLQKLRLYDFSKIHDGSLVIEAIAPDYLDVAPLNLLAFASKNYEERIDQFLYTAAGSQGTCCLQLHLFFEMFFQLILCLYF